MSELPFSIPTVPRDLEGKVGMLMTGSAHTAARRAGIMGIEANLEAMAQIASIVGVSDTQDPGEISPQLLVVRDSRPERGGPGWWDSRVPRDPSSRVADRYFPAGDLTPEHPPSWDRDEAYTIARGVGISALHEVSVEDWRDEAGFARRYADALLFGRVALGRRAPWWGRVVSDVGHTLSGGSHGDFKLRNRVDQMAREGTLGSPFILRKEA